MSKAAFLAAFIAASPAAAYAQDWVVAAPPSAPVAAGAIVGAPGYYYAPGYYDYVEAAPAPVYPGRVIVGEVLPPNVVYYPAPPEVGVTRYRYTIWNNEPVLVEPRTRRVIEVLD